jgi:hypothetical protein
MHEINKKVDYKDIALRAGKTFVQAFLAALAVADEPLSKTALIGACAAAVSVTWNWFKATL